MTRFWRTWLTAWSGLVVVFGAVLALGAMPQTDGVTRMLLSIMNPGANGPFDDLHRFSIGLMGAVTLGWGLTFWAAFQAAFALGDRAAPIWRSLTFAALVWYGIDSAISIHTGFALNAASNTILLILYLIPVLATGAMGETKAPARG